MNIEMKYIIRQVLLDALGEWIEARSGNHGSMENYVLSRYSKMIKESNGSYISTKFIKDKIKNLEKAELYISNHTIEELFIDLFGEK
jgi:hypothetical protein